MPDATQAFLDSLPELRPGERFRFACHPGVPCFNACCSDLTLVLTPYDVLRLRRALDLSGREFIARHAHTALAPDTGFPQLRLAMRDDLPGKPCPFVTPQGCGVYPHRPGACRTYPLGRAARTGDQGRVVEQFFVVQEEHCRGFEQDASWTAAEWLGDQDLAAYNAANDRYMLLPALARERGLLDRRQANLVFLAAYNLDAFRDFLVNTKALDRLDLSDADKAGILDDEDRRLDFAVDWLGLVLFGRQETLRQRTP